MLILLCSSCSCALVLPSENRNAWKVVFNLQKPTVKRFGALQEIWDIYRMKSTKTMEIVKLCHALYCDVNEVFGMNKKNYDHFSHVGDCRASHLLGKHCTPD